MWKFFNQPIPREAVPSSIPYKQNIKVSSIFLISRSSCAFVNLETQDELLLAISFFNHRLLRPSDPRCPKLVCRVRKMDDDLKAGVGGQRGAGIHTKYVQDMLARQKAEAEGGSIDVKTPEPETPLSPAAMEFPPEGEGRRRSSVMANVITPAAFAAWQRERSQSGTHSFASTNSSFLGRHFPKRYFILKSLTHVSFGLGEFWDDSPLNVQGNRFCRRSSRRVSRRASGGRNCITRRFWVRVLGHKQGLGFLLI